MFYTGVNEKYLPLPPFTTNVDSSSFSAMKKCNPAEKHIVLRYYQKPTVVSIIRKLTIAETVDVRNIAH